MDGSHPRRRVLGRDPGYGVGRHSNRGWFYPTLLTLKLDLLADSSGQHLTDDVEELVVIEETFLGK